MIGDAEPEAGLAPAGGDERREDGGREIDWWMYQFTAQLAHDVRAPLGAIFMWAHVLRSAGGYGDQSPIDAIEASARHQSRLMGELVDMARAVVGRLKIDTSATDLRAIVRAAVEDQTKDARSRQVTLDWDGTAVAPASAVVDADPKRLQQAIACVVRHGIAATPGEGALQIRLSPGQTAGATEVRVHLAAGGMAAAAADDLFIPYRAVGLDLTEARPDFGLGLVFARHVARLHGGALELENGGPGGPCTFVLRLPSPAGPSGLPPAR